MLDSAPAEMYQSRPRKFPAPSDGSSPTQRLPKRSNCSRLVCPPTKANGRTVPFGSVPEFATSVKAPLEIV